MHLDGTTGIVSDHRFAHLVSFFKPGDLLIFNDTRVIRARMHGVKDSGGKVEVMIERILGGCRALAMLRASRVPRVGQRIVINDAVELVVEARIDALFELRFPDDVVSVLDQFGQIPLPPYIVRAPDASDESRYQTVYAREAGAVAAPTAGLHFDEVMLQSLCKHGVECAYVTLHVGAGTFQPVREENTNNHVMHEEWYRVPEATVQAIHRARENGGRVCAVGTTSLRALESAALGGELLAGSAETRLFIRPGFKFRVVERLLTNFHLPRSTLLMLVSAFAGIENIKRAYRHAVDTQYRFFSYGDAMLIERCLTAG